MRGFLFFSIFCGAWFFGLGQVRAADVSRVKQHVAKLTTEMGSEDADVRQKAYQKLLELGSAAKPAVPQLVRVLDDRESPLRSRVASALGHILPPHVDMMELFPEMRFHAKWDPVSEWTPQQRAKLERAINEANAEAAGAIVDALPVMVKALREDEDPYVREYCAMSLGACGSLAKAAVPSLIEALDDEQEPVRACAVHALADIGPNAAAAVKPLMDYLRRQKISRLRNSAIDALGRIGPAARDAVPLLIEELEHAESGRFSAATALGRIGPPAQLAIPALLKALNDEERLLRAAAAEALGNIGVRDSKVLRKLEESTTDEDSYVQHHAQRALRHLTTEPDTRPNREPNESRIDALQLEINLESKAVNDETLPKKQTSFEVKRHPGIVCIAFISPSIVQQGTTAVCTIALTNSTTDSLTIPSDLLGYISLRVRETDATLQAGKVHSAKGAPDIELGPGKALSTSFSIFTTKEQKYPDGPRGAIGCGPLLEKAGRYQLEFLVFGQPVSELLFTLQERPDHRQTKHD